jgi:hypothetical protein
VKPGWAKSGITWAALQATFYAGLFRKWIDFVGDTEAKDTITRMLRQRIDLGLSDEPRHEFKTPIDIKPIVAIGDEVENVGLERLFIVQEGLVNMGVGYDKLEVWNVEPSVSCRRMGTGASPTRTTITPKLNGMGLRPYSPPPLVGPGSGEVPEAPSTQGNRRLELPFSFVVAA